MSRIYVATKWEHRGRAKEFMQMLEKEGHTISYDWTQGEEVNAFQAMADLEGVKAADCIVCLFEWAVPYVGALIEMGAALGLGKPVYVIGKSPVTDTLFFKHPLVRRGVDVFIEEVLNKQDDNTYEFGGR